MIWPVTIGTWQDVYNWYHPQNNARTERKHIGLTEPKMDMTYKSPWEFPTNSQFLIDHDIPIIIFLLININYL